MDAYYINRSVYTCLFVFVLSEQKSRALTDSFFYFDCFACSKEDKELDSKKLKSFAKNILLLCQKMGGYPQRRRA